VLLLLAAFLAIFVLPAPWGLVAVIGAGALEIAEAGFWIWFSKRRKAAVGAETLVGRTAVTITPCRPFGQVRVDGEIWAARCEEGVAAGEDVYVVGLDGLTLRVSPATPRSDAAATG
jgi:membrane protein implicated in regulation of membrane protease activity